MNLLIFTPYYPPHIGGLESHAEEFNKHLANKDFIITVFSPRLPKDAPEKQIDNEYLTIIRYPAWEIIPNYPLPKFWSLKFWRLFCGLYKQSFDITISRTRFFFTSFIALIFAKTKRTKFIHIEHGSDFVQLSSKFKSFIAKLYDYTFGWLVFKCSDLNISISKAVQGFVYKFDKRSSPVIHRGINISEIDAIKKNNLWKEKHPNKIIIGFVGRLIDGKGLLDLIESLHRISNQPFICLIIGDGSQKNILQKNIDKYNLQHKVFLLGQRTRPEAIALMKSFDIFVNPSYTEGLPTSVLESSICQNAIIATDVGGTAEIIKHHQNGYLIEPRDKQSLQKYLLVLINNPARIRKLGKTARRSTKQNFSWQKSIKKYENAFKKILATE